MIDCGNMIKDCFWEYSFTEDDILQLAQSKNTSEQKFLFEKILLNSTHLFNDLKVFEMKDLKKLIFSYEIPSFNAAHAFKRKNLAEVYFLNKPLLVNELKWIA